MKRLLSGFVLVALAALLSGCYYDPGYSYVRATPYAGPAYYGNGYYAAPGWYGYDGWYGCCYAPGVTIGGVWYSRGGYRHYRGSGWRGGYGHPSGGSHGHWSGHRGDHHH